MQYPEINEEKLTAYIDAAITFYKQVSGKLPLTFHIQRLLGTAGISQPLGILNPITQELLKKHRAMNEENT